MTADDEGSDGWPHFEPGELERETLRRAIAGDREAALDAIDRSISALAAGGISRELGTYLACALEQVYKNRELLTGETFLRAFNLTRERKRPPERDRTLSRDIDIAAWVHIAVERGLSYAEAKGQAQVRFDIENIDRCLRNAGPVHSVNVDAYEERFLREGRPLPLRR